MKYVGIRFILSHGSFLNVVVKEEFAATFLDGWLRGTLTEYVGEYANTPAGRQTWAVKVDDIKGFHTFDLEQVVQPQGQGSRPVPAYQPPSANPNLPWGRSGI